MIPDWHYAVECSVWDNMCGATSIRENKYKPYPFPLSRHLKNLDEFDHQPMLDVPDEWLDALNADNRIDNPPTRPISYEYPPEVPAMEVSKCIQDSNNLTWQIQIDNLLDSGRIKKEQSTNMVAFTISDYNYAYDMMHGIFEMNDDIVGFGNSFFMVALDKDTVEMACTYGYPVVAWFSAKPNEIIQLKRDVANTKFEVSLYLVTKGIDFFFYEMDVWFLTSPKELIASYHGEDKHDLLLSSHMKDPQSINIGVFSVTANQRTQEFFEICVKMAQESPGTHDQWVMAQLLLLAWTITETGRPGLTLTRMWYPPPKHNPPTMNHPPYYGLYNTMEMMAGEHPIPTKNTIAIHTLCKGPLKKPFGKKIIAKELGAWTGFTGPSGAAGYYARTGANRRYLWMDGHDSPNTYNTVQNFEWDSMNAESLIVNHAESFRWTMAVLLSLARRTGRIFQMPKLISEEGAHYLWTVMDFEPVDEMNIDYRETNFPHNKKSWHSEANPFQSVARTALAPINSVDKESTMYVQYPNKATALRGGSSSDEGIIKAWKFDNKMSEENALDAWWALHTAIPEVDSAELLLVNPHFMSATYTSTLRSKLNRDDYTPSVAEKEIFDVYSKLKWCPGDKIVVKDHIVGRSSAELSCHG
ncbi:hypothetical protein ACHAXR_006892, partial [Thalassiosira sp. AJA248-18]